MARRVKKKNRYPPFVPVFLDEMDSEAFRQLTGTAVKVLLHFKRIHGKLCKKFGNDFDGTFDFTYSEAGRYGFSRSTFSRAISELSDKGFIVIVSVGGLRGAGRTNSRYSLSQSWCLYGMKNGGRVAFVAKPRRPSEP